MNRNHCGRKTRIDEIFTDQWKIREHQLKSAVTFTVVFKKAICKPLFY